MPLKTTFLTGEYPPMQGGIADHIARLAGYMQPLEVEPSILIGRRWQETAGVLPSSNSNRPQVYAVLPDWGWRCWPAIARFLVRHRPAILHIQYQAAAFDLGGWVNWLPWFLKKRKAAIRVVTTFHDLRRPYIFPKAGALRQQAILALARHSDAVICTNREDLGRLQARLPATAGAHLNLIPLGSNVEPQPPSGFDRNAWRAQYQAGPEALLLAYFGFMNASKGGEALIEALALLRQQGIDARLLLIGGEVGHADPTNLAYARRVQTSIEQNRLEDVVYRTGYITLPDVSANLLAVDAVVMPYRDGVSFRRTTLIAALRHGCPIVSTKPADPALIPEVIPAENMLLAPPEDGSALAQVIMMLVNNQSLRERLSQGAKKLGGLFEWQKIATETVNVYHSLTRASA